MMAIFYLGVPLLTSGPGFPLQVLGPPKSAPVGFPLQSLTQKKQYFVILNEVKNLKQPSLLSFLWKQESILLSNTKAELQTPLSGGQLFIY